MNLTVTQPDGLLLSMGDTPVCVHSPEGHSAPTPDKLAMHSANGTVVLRLKRAEGRCVEGPCK